MNKVKLVFGIFTLVASAAVLSVIANRVDATDRTACVIHDFKTELYKQACAKGGQHEAKDVAKAFMKEKKIKSCNQCHSKLAPKYELKADGLQQFHKLGGK